MTLYEFLVPLVLMIPAAGIALFLRWEARKIDEARAEEARAAKRA